MSDLAKRVEAVENQLRRGPDQECWRVTKLGLFWMSVGIIIGAILEQLLYGLDRLGIPPYWQDGDRLILPYLYLLFGMPALSLALAIFLCLDYVRRRKANQRRRTLTLKASHFVFYVLMLAGGFVGFILLAEWVEGTLWRNFKEVI